MRLHKTVALQRLRRAGYTGAALPKCAVFFDSGTGLRAGTMVGCMGPPSLMECVLRFTCVDILSSTSGAKAKKTVSYPQFFSLLHTWSTTAEFSKEMAISSREYPQANAAFLLKKMVEIVHGGEGDKPVMKYLQLLIFSEGWNWEVRINLMNMCPQCVLLPCHVKRPQPRAVWRHTGHQRVYMALGGTREKLAALGATLLRPLSEDVHAFMVSFVKSPTGVHGGCVDDVLLFGWSCNVGDLLAYCPASVDMRSVCIVKGIAYVHEYRVLTERLVGNAMGLLRNTFSPERIQRVATASEMRALRQIAGRAEERKRLRALKVGKMPPCVEAVVYRNDGRHPKHRERWMTAGVVRTVANLSQTSVFDLLNSVAMKVAWQSMPSDSTREFFAGLGVEGSTPSKLYTVTCKMMNEAHPCPYNGNAQLCKKESGQGGEADGTVATNWLDSTDV